MCRVVNTTSGANFCTMMCTHGLVCRQIVRPGNNTALSDNDHDFDDEGFGDSQSSEISPRRHHRKPRDIAISLCLPQVSLMDIRCLPLVSGVTPCPVKLYRPILSPRAHMGGSPFASSTYDMPCQPILSQYFPRQFHHCIFG